MKCVMKFTSGKPCTWKSVPGFPCCAHHALQYVEEMTGRTHEEVLASLLDGVVLAPKPAPDARLTAVEEKVTELDKRLAEVEDYFT